MAASGWRTLLLLLLPIYGVAETKNKFEATWGCLQYNAYQGYESAHPYFSTALFENTRTTKDNVTTMRMGVLAKNDGHIRLSPVEYPYDFTEMNEIVLSGWSNTKNEVRRYTRIDPNRRIDIVVLKSQSSLGMLSQFSPLMFTMEVYPSGEVKFIKDGDVRPFMTFRDPKISLNYIGFCSFDVPVIYFFDCPLEVDRRDCNRIV